MPKPPCDFKIVQTTEPNGKVVYSTDPSFPDCTVRISVNGQLAGSHVGDDVGDYHIVQLGHDSVTLRPLKDGAQGTIQIEIECFNCGPTTKRFGERPPSKLPLWLAIILAPFSFLLWLLLEILAGIQQMWIKIQQFWNKIKAALGI